MSGYLRWGLISGVALVLFALAFVAWPIHAALVIRDAMIEGDIETLNRKVEWDSLRASLKSSLTPETIARLSADPEAPKRSLWQSVKAAVAPRFADTVIDRYVTPEQLPVFLGYREIYKGSIRPALRLKEPPGPLASTPLADTRIDRLLGFWKRVRKAVFVTPRRLLLEVEDKYRPQRRYTGTFELKDYQWKLTGLTIAGL